MDSAAGKREEGKEADCSRYTGGFAGQQKRIAWLGGKGTSLLLTSLAGGQQARMVCERATGHGRGGLLENGIWGTLDCANRKPRGLARFSKVPASGLRAF